MNPSIRVTPTGEAKRIVDAKIVDRSKTRKRKTREAVNLALKGKWKEAVQANEEILRIFPTDVEALNRLGKALMEIGRYSEAQDVGREVLKHSPYNRIAKKNLQRLVQFEARGQQAKTPQKALAHRFVEDSGRSALTTLIRTARTEVLERVASGDAVELELQGQVLLVRTGEGEYLGQVEPRLGMTLSRLISGGNRYEGVVASARPHQLSVLVIEAFRHPDQSHIPLPRRHHDYGVSFNGTDFVEDVNGEYETDDANVLGGEEAVGRFP